jgi:hypothetical protein
MCHAIMCWRGCAEQEIKVDWLEPAIANDLISGSYHGALSQVARQLLEKLNFILVYNMTPNARRITRIVIVGAAKGEPSPALPALQAALKQAETSKESSPVNATQPATSSRRGPSSSALLREPASALSRNVGDAHAPVPTPIATSGPQPVPVARPAPSDLIPAPITTGLPSVAPIAGADLPMLPGPQSTRGPK